MKDNIVCRELEKNIRIKKFFLQYG